MISHWADDAALRRDFERIDSTAQAVEGWLEREEGKLLFFLASAIAPSGNIVEIGSWLGRLTIYLAGGARLSPGARVTSVDSHQYRDNRQALRENLERAGLSHIVELRSVRSDTASERWQEPVDLLFVDGDHSYNGVRSDFLAWSRFMAPGSIVIFHDAEPIPKNDGGWWSFRGVTRFTDELACQELAWRRTKIYVSCRVFERLSVEQ